MTSTRVTTDMQVRIESDEPNLYSDDEEEQDVIETGDSIDVAKMAKFHNAIDEEEFFWF